MGSYGIGLGRSMAAIVEQKHDDKGIVWPMSIAPYHVYIVVIKNKDEAQMELANKLYDDLRANGIDVIMDDRDDRPGVKFKDSELIGIPVRVTVGKKAGENIIEFKERTDEKARDMNAYDVLSTVQEIMKNQGC
jgi:prolyl-tRNA synthetase